MNATPALTVKTFPHHAMGGRFDLHLYLLPDDPRDWERVVTRILSRVDRWVLRLSRFVPNSEINALNEDRRAAVPVTPLLAAVLDWGRTAQQTSDGVVNPALLDALLAAQAGVPWEGYPFLPPAPPETSAYTVLRTEMSPVVVRPPGTHLDLGGIAKGWIADRTLALLDAAPGALVDADGDLALRPAQDEAWTIGVGDPRDPRSDLATLHVDGSGLPTHTWGLGTSGITVQAWTHGERHAHHLIDPGTGQPAQTDLLQVTVLAASARLAETYAKTAVILGRERGTAFLDDAPVAGAILLTDAGETLALPRTQRWLA
jgi:thiamine biosynthesis lipoprotein